MRFTVFTPTYNRAYLIDRLYRSLQRQSFTDFEWVVVDDGSSDDTRGMFGGYLADTNPFPIRYVYQENGGKHRAINKGLELAEGELFYIVDSDDYLPDDALQIIDAVEKTVPVEEKHQFGGVCGLKGTENHGVLGRTFSGDVLDITSLQRFGNGISGDKAEVFYTALLKQYPFPEFEGENFITEAVVWDRIAGDGYKLRFFNQVVMICQYMPDGLTASGDEIFKRNPHGWGLYIHQCDKYKKINGFPKWEEYMKFYFSNRGKMSFREIAGCVKMNPVVFWLRLAGLKLFLQLYR